MDRVKKLFSNNFRGDLYGGFMASVVALPLALAFGVSSGIGAIAGLYGAIAVGLFASIFGGTPSQISGPTGPMTVVMTSIVIDYMARFPESGLALAFTVVMLGGLFQILFGYLKIGKYISMVPYAVISGFMTGIGIIIIILELPALLGHDVTGGVLSVIAALPQFANQINYTELLLGLLVITLIFTWPKRLQSIIPASLFCILAIPFLVTLFFSGDVHILGEIPTGFPEFNMPVFEMSLIFTMLKSALVLGLLGAIDSLLTSLVADTITQTHHDSEKELIGQGIGNIVAGLFGGLPGAGATMRTVVNVRSGGHSRLSGVIHALILLSIVLGVGHYASYIPHAVLAGILITVGIQIIDWGFIKRIKKLPYRTIMTMLVVFTMTVFVDLITAVAVGIIMSSLSTVKRMADMQIKLMKEITPQNAREYLSSADANLLAKSDGSIVLYQLQGPLSFGAAKQMLKTMSKKEGIKTLILDMSDVSMVDVTTSLTLEDLIKRAKARGQNILLVGLQAEILAQFHQWVITDIPLEDLYYETVSKALKKAL